MLNHPENDNARGQAGESGKANCVEQRNFTPSYPSYGTHPARLLAAMLRRQQVNPLDGWRRLGIYRLADTAFQLRGMGWPVITGNLEVHNRFGEKCRVAEYRLAPEAIEAAGLEGQEFARCEREQQEVA